MIAGFPAVRKWMKEVDLLTGRCVASVIFDDTTNGTVTANVGIDGYGTCLSANGPNRNAALELIESRLQNETK